MLKENGNEGDWGDEDRMGHEEVLDLDLDISGAETEDFSPNLTEYLLPVYWDRKEDGQKVWDCNIYPCVASIGLRGSDPASADSDYPQKTKEGAK